jgi:hypothetical protein
MAKESWGAKTRVGTFLRGSVSSMNHRSISVVSPRASLVAALTLAILGLFGGCKKGEGSPPAGGSTSTSPKRQAATAPPTGAPAAPAATDDAPPDMRRFDAAGLTVVANADGTIRLTGQDRWQNAIDTTYADLTYLRNAMPVIERTVTEPQFRALRAVLEQLAADAGIE